MPRRGWDSLSDAYRGRLERSGVTRTAYESGASIAKARGHTSEAVERARSTDYRVIDKWVAHYSSTYNKDPQEVRSALMATGRPNALATIKAQKDMERLYSAGQIKKAQTRYQMPNKPATPDWLFYYHGAFS